MRRVWLERAADLRYAVMGELPDGSTRCYGRYATEPEAQRRLSQVARSAALAPAPVDSGELADSYKLNPVTPRA